MNFRRALAALIVCLGPALLVGPAMSAPPAADSPEVARILAAGGCVLLDAVPSHPLAEVAREPAKFAGRRLRLRAVYEQTPQGARLVAEPAAAGPAFAVALAPLKGAERRLRERGLARLRSKQCAGRAVVAVRGVLRLDPQTGGTFEVEQFEAVDPAGLPFNGTLTAGECYRAPIVFETDGTFRLVTPLWVPPHHAGHLEWTNLRQLPQLRRVAATPPTSAVVFRVLSRRIDKVGDAYRWHTTYRCQIYRLD